MKKMKPDEKMKNTTSRVNAIVLAAESSNFFSDPLILLFAVILA